MCGFVGFVDKHASLMQAEEALVLMSDTLVHRGPDDSGTWFDLSSGIGFGHRRLSILDLSSAGHQPMMSHDKRFVIAFNGEIYNHLELRDELESGGFKIDWNGHSDTETLLAGFDCWGIKETIEKSIGMFAFSVWDHKETLLTLGRDRLGEKPLYYGWQGDKFLFGSELKALRVHSAFNAEINRDSITLL